MFYELIPLDLHLFGIHEILRFQPDLMNRTRGTYVQVLHPASVSAYQFSMYIHIVCVHE